MRNPHPRVLHITENRHIGQYLALALRRQGCSTYVQLHTGLELAAFLRNYEPRSALFDLYLVDIDSVGLEWDALAHQLRAFAPEAIIILLGRSFSEAVRSSGPADRCFTFTANVSDTERMAASIMGTLTQSEPSHEDGTQAGSTPHRAEDDVHDADPGDASRTER